jgi:hypothetical protein
MVYSSLIANSRSMGEIDNITRKVSADSCWSIYNCKNIIQFLHYVLLYVVRVIIINDILWQHLIYVYIQG